MKKSLLLLLSIAQTLASSSQKPASSRISVKTDGNHISITHLDDVVSFCSRGEIVVSGYNGLTNEKFVNELVDKQNYIEMLKYLWSEKDHTKRRTWLLTKAENGHVICMLELSKEYAKIKDLQKSNEWFEIGMLRARQDALCCTDKSVVAAIDALQCSYHPASDFLLDLGANLKTYMANKKIRQIKEKEFRECRTMQKKARKVILKKCENFKYPSPLWISYHGNIFTNLYDREPLVPMKEWNEIRKKEQIDTLKDDELLNINSLDDLSKSYSVK